MVNDIEDMILNIEHKVTYQWRDWFYGDVPEDVDVPGLGIVNVEKTLATLHSLRDLGVRIALDDFGTGYSSLSYLRSFPFDKVKIDRSFVEDLASGGNAHAVIRAITTLADALGMQTLAEGVEDTEQLDILRREGCGYIQGFLFSEPLAAADVMKLLDVEQDKRVGKVA